MLSMDVKRVDGKFTVFSNGGRINTGLDMVEFAKKGEELGAGEICLNSIDTDGVKKGFDIEMLETLSRAVNIPIIASGGAGCAQDFVTLFKKLPKVDAGLGASIFHFKEVAISDLKKLLKENGIEVRL